MTIQHPIRRALARVCSADTMARIVDPILADIDWERGRPAWRGYTELTTALLIHAVTSTPSVMSSIWLDDRRAMPKAALLCGAVALVTTAALAIPPLLRLDVPLGRGLLFLAPQFLILTLPAALLSAIPIALSSVWLLRGAGTSPLLIAWVPNAVTLGIAALFFQNRGLFLQNKSTAIPPSP